MDSNTTSYSRADLLDALFADGDIVELRRIAPGRLTRQSWHVVASSE